jgi:hypothetical protein
MIARDFRAPAFAVLALSLAACSPTTRSTAVAVSDTTQSSLLRVVDGNHTLLFGGSATWSRTADGISVIADGRQFLFRGMTAADRIPLSRGTRHASYQPVQCATCDDGGNGGKTTAGSVQSVTNNDNHLDVIYTSSGTDTIEISGVDAGGNTYGGFSDTLTYTPGTLVDATYDGSVFGGTVYPHGTVTVISGGRIVGTGSW